MVIQLVTPTATEIEAAARPWQRVGVAWLEEVRQRTGSERTPTEYGRYVARFLASVDDPAQTTPAMVHTFAYAPGPSGKTPSASTVTVRLAALRGFFDFARRMRLIDRNPADDVKRPKAQEPTPRGLDADELRALLAAIPATPGGTRDKAIIITATLTGLRRSEVLGLRAGDIERRGGTVFYDCRTKGGKERHRELPAPAWSAIERWLAVQGVTLETLEDDAPLFPVSSHGFYKNLQRYATRAGLPPISPHVLRHSAAKLRRDTGASIEDVGRFLGHSSLHTTSRYLARLEGERDTGWQGVAALIGVES